MLWLARGNFEVLSYGSEVLGDSASLGCCALGPCAAHRAVRGLRPCGASLRPRAVARVSLAAALLGVPVAASLCC
eukprot:13127316-Alexandrium_andersonii.AAC.1